MKKYIIDVYNLLNSPALSAPLNMNLEQQRDHLIRIIKSNSQLEQCEIVIVFDNSSSSKIGRVSGSGKVQIMFTKTSMEADEVIKKLIRKEKDPSRLMVVSSDRAIQFAANDHGAGNLSSEDYCRLFDRKTSSSPKHSEGGYYEKYDPNLGDKEISNWKRLFEQDGEGEE